MKHYLLVITSGEHKRLKQLALDCDMTIKELILDRTLGVKPGLELDGEELEEGEVGNG